MASVLKRFLPCATCFGAPEVAETTAKAPLAPAQLTPETADAPVTPTQATAGAAVAEIPAIATEAAVEPPAPVSVAEPPATPAQPTPAPVREAARELQAEPVPATEPTVAAVKEELVVTENTAVPDEPITEVVPAQVIEPKVEDSATSPFAAAQETIAEPPVEPTAPAVLPTPEAVAAPVADLTPEVTEAVPVVAEPKAVAMAAEVAEPTSEVATATPVAEFESVVGAQPGTIAGLVTPPPVAETLTLPAALTNMPTTLISLPEVVADRFAGAAAVPGFADIEGATELKAAAPAAAKPATDAMAGFMPAGAGA